jgi:hypothetical protein
MTVPFARAWWSFELGDLRPCEDDYDPFPIESLPPIDTSLLTGDYAWLVGDEDDEDDQDESGDDDDIATLMGTSPTAKKMAKLVKGLAKVKVTLPPAFVRFMEDANLQGAVPSCTGCEWELGNLVESPFEDDAWMVRFLRDPEDALHWFLYLTPAGSYVVCSSAKLDDPKLDEPPAALQEKTWWCAPDFESFVYRFWLENVLWEQLEDKGMLTPTEKKYLKHYADAAKKK